METHQKPAPKGEALRSKRRFSGPPEPGLISTDSAWSPAAAACLLVQHGPVCGFEVECVYNSSAHVRRKARRRLRCH